MCKRDFYALYIFVRASEKRADFQTGAVNIKSHLSSSQSEKERKAERNEGRALRWLPDRSRVSLRRSLCCGNFVHSLGVPIQVMLRRHDVDDPVDPRNLVDYYETLRIYLLREELHVFLRENTYLFARCETYRMNVFFINFTCFYITFI